MLQVWPNFMSQTILQSQNLGNFNKQNCERNFAKLTRFLPDEHSLPIDHMVRNLLLPCRLGLLLALDMSFIEKCNYS